MLPSAAPSEVWSVLVVVPAVDAEHLLEMPAESVETPRDDLTSEQQQARPPDQRAIAAVEGCGAIIVEGQPILVLSDARRRTHSDQELRRPAVSTSSTALPRKAAVTLRSSEFSLVHGLELFGVRSPPKVSAEGLIAG
jgi:hypothetical protein